MVDYPDAGECFPGVDIAGGVCYFLWVKGHTGPCEVTNIYRGVLSKSTRPLNEFPTFVRNGLAVPIIQKVQAYKEPNMSEVVSSRKPFGLATTDRPSNKGDLILVWNAGKGAFEREKVSIGKDIIDKWKVITSYVSFDHAGQPGKDGTRKVFSKIQILPPGTICTESYLVIGSFDSKKGAENLHSYLKTRFLRFLIAQLSSSHHITKERYLFVPIQDFTEEWTDEKLYKKYGITPEEVVFIESMIRPME